MSMNLEYFEDELNTSVDWGRVRWLDFGLATHFQHQIEVGVNVN